MPIPKPQKDEKQTDFISRCMSDEIMKKEYPEQAERTAVCFQQWKTKDKRDEKGRIIVAENVPIIIGATIEVLE
jgi:hypothetical protein